MMNTNTKLYEALYVSTIAPDAPLSVVSEIAATSRTWNVAHDITGLLIFDGMRFCQQLEGRQKDVLALVERISNDTRHTHVTVFHHGAISERRFRSFALAFTNVDDIEVLGRLEQLDGQPGVDAFTALVATLDLVT